MVSTRPWLEAALFRGVGQQNTAIGHFVNKPLTVEERAEVEHVKLVCQAVAAEKTTDLVIRAAHVSPGVWSHYASTDDQHLDKNLPFWRAVLIQRATGRDDFTRLLAERSKAAEPELATPRALLTAQLVLLAETTAATEAALADGQLTETERLHLAGLTEKLCANASRLHARVVAQPTNVTELYASRSALAT